MRRRHHDVLLTGVRLLAFVCALLALPRWVLADTHDPIEPEKRIVVVDAGATAPSGSSTVAAPTTDVKIRDKVVFTFRAPHADKSPVARAKESQVAIDGLLAHPEQLGDVRYEETSNLAVVFVGKTPVITLGQEDAEVSGEALNVLAAKVTTRVADGVSAEIGRAHV